MTGLLITFAIVIFCTTLGTMVALRAWDYFPSRLFVLAVALLVLMNIITATRTQIVDPRTGYVFAALSVVTLALLTTALLLLFSAIFVPEWWHGSRPVRWIVLPYALISLLLLIDIVARTGWFIDGLRLQDGVYRLNPVRPNAMVVLTLFTLGWLVHVVLLVRVAITQPAVRLTASLLGIALLITITANSVSTDLQFVQRFSNIMATVPIISAMAYAVLRTRLLTPTRAGIDQAVAAMDDALVILDNEDTVTFANQAAARLGVHPHHALPDALHDSQPAPDDDEPFAMLIDLESLATSHTLTLEGRQLIISRTPVTDGSGNQIGTLLLGRDVTEIEQRTAQLALERERLNETVSQLESEKQGRLQLAAAVRALSMPVIPVLDGVLILPLIGEFDAARIEDFNTALLTSIERQRARLVLIDITGLPQLDESGAAGLLQGVSAARLLGARCVLVGVRPEIAQALVSLGISLEDIATTATLQQALWPQFRQSVQIRSNSQ